MSALSIKRRLQCCVLIVCLLLLTTGNSAVGAVLYYEIADLGPVNYDDTFPNSEVYGMNAAGDAVGRATHGNDYNHHPVIWSTSEPGVDVTAVDLGPATIVEGRGKAINDAGVICGYHGGPSLVTRGMIWTAPNVYNEIPGFYPDGNVTPQDINNANLVCGYAVTEECNACWHGFTWDGETLVDVGTFEGEAGFGLQSKARGMNDLGQIVGEASYNDGDPWNSRIRAFLYLPEPAYGLPAGLHDIDDWSWEWFQISWGVDINNQGQVLVSLDGVDESDYTYSQFALWLPEPAYGLPAGMTNLGNPGNGLSTAFPRRINEHGEIVGKAKLDPDDPFAPFTAYYWYNRIWTLLWDKLQPADQAAWNFEVAEDINDDGVIIGIGTYPGSGQVHAFRLDPVYDATAVPGTPEAPGSVVFHAAHPNPFNPRTSLTFSLTESRQVELSVHDLRGSLVAKLQSGHLAAGRHTISWDGQTLAGNAAAAGTYLVKLRAGSSLLHQKISLVK